MKAKISEQELTDYALNELGPDERIYVESMLGASEEAREDIYQMIEVAMMLDAGFEREETREPAVLTAEQRRALLGLRVPNVFLRNSAATLAAAACVAFAFMHHDAWMPQFSLPGAVASTSAAGSSGLQADVIGVETDFVTQLMQFRQLTEDPVLRKWFRSLPGGVNALPAVSFDGAQRASLDLMP